MEERKFLKKVRDVATRERVQRAVIEITKNPYGGELVEARKRSRLRRQKFGDIRITYHVNQGAVEIVDISNRSDTYRPRQVRG